MFGTASALDLVVGIHFTCDALSEYTYRIKLDSRRAAEVSRCTQFMGAFGEINNQNPPQFPESIRP
jgi:hypothetical protein